ncbi:MAG: nuclear transport factor 2 family protein, partial [Bacteroidota bacterium]
DESLRNVNALDFFRKAIKPGPVSDRKTHILSMQIDGNSAHARLRIDYENLSLIDNMNLLWLDGKWQIVSKIFTGIKR